MPHVNRADPGPDGLRVVVDRDILSKTTGYSIATIRKHLHPDEYDPGTGRALYDRDAAMAELRRLGVEPRPATRVPRRNHHFARRRRNP